MEHLSCSESTHALRGACQEVINYAPHTGASSGPWSEEGVWGTKSQGAFFLNFFCGFLLPSLQRVGAPLSLKYCGARLAV